MIGRSLFEESLWLRELSDDKDRRTSLVLGWGNSSLSEKEGLIREAISLGLEKPDTDILPLIAAERESLHAFKRKCSIDRPAAFLQPRVAALKYGRKHDYWTYALSHEFVHGSEPGWIFSGKKDPDGTVKFFAKSADNGLLVATAAYCATSFEDACKSACDIFGWEFDQQFAALVEQLRASVPVGAG